MLATGQGLFSLGDADFSYQALDGAASDPDSAHFWLEEK
jgi:hypothetical protein